MRVLVIGYPLPNPQFDNYNLLTAPSWFDYDGVFIDPLSVSTVIEDVINASEEHRTFAGEPVLNRRTSPLAVGLGDMVRRRREEASRLLANGGLIVALAQPNVIHEAVAGFPGCDRYAWLPAPAGLAYEPPFIVRADGMEALPADAAHPFALLIHKYRRRFAYRVRFEESVPGFAAAGRVIARSPGNATVGVELRVGEGRVLFLPAVGGVAYGDQRYELATDLYDAMRAALLQRAEEEPPFWAAGVELPGTEALDEAVQEAEARLDEAEQALEEALQAREGVVKYRGLLWQEGTRGLAPLVHDAFELLGFEVQRDPELPGWIEFGGVRALYEVEAASGTVSEYPFFRLQRRLEEDLVNSHRPKRGLIVINGHHLQNPEARPGQASETLRLAAETYRYGLLTTQRLFEMVKAVLERPDEEGLRSSLRDTILNAAGEVPADVIPPRPEPEPEPEPETEAP